MSLAVDLHRAWTRALRATDRKFDVSCAHEQKATNAVVQRMRTEAAMLNGSRMCGDAPRVSYAAGQCRCDARLVLEGGEHVLVESKWHWKSYWVDRGNESKARTYLFAPLEGRDNKSAVLDLTKLAGVRDAGGVRHVALVIVAHSRPPHGASADLDELRHRALLDNGPWESAPSDGDGRWPSPRWSGYEYDVRVVTCATSQLGEWWTRFEPLVRAAGWSGR